MSCDVFGKLIPLYHYGELMPDEEDRLEEHLHGCAACTREMERQRALARLLDKRQRELPPMLLQECRAGLMAAIEGGAPQPVAAAKGPWKLFLEALGATFAGFERLRVPAGAVALVAIGFVAARLTGSASLSAPGDSAFAIVRSVESEGNGMVRILFDETRRREILRRKDDSDIQKLLLAGARQDDPAVRVESVGLLRNRADSGEVRDALLNALAHDSNIGVRLKAMEAIRGLGGAPEVMNTLAQVLETDDSPALRMQAVDQLVAARDDRVVGVLQNVVQREPDSSVRRKLQKALEEMNASIGTF